MVPDPSQQSSSEPADEQISQSRKMEAIGYLAGGVAHDFNNLLGVILGYCEMLEQQDTLPLPARTMIDEIHHAGAAAKKLTRGLLAFTRRQAPALVALDLNQAVSEMNGMLARMVGDNVQLLTVLGADLGTIEVDPSQLDQLLMNLVINARDSMPDGGTIRIETANLDMTEQQTAHQGSAGTVRYVTLMVSDEGRGMDATTRAHIFEPFFSTKISSGGTGLGLSIVQGIVQRSGAAITVQSAPASGSTFLVRFPRTDAAPAVLQKRVAMPLSGGTETILLVDDALALRTLTRRILEDCGYFVLDAGDSAAALRMAQDHAGPLHLMITDVLMPGISGFDLAAQLAVFRPDTRVLYATGYANGFAGHSSGRAAGYTLLEKPFTREDLLRCVRALLDSSSSFSPCLTATPFRSAAVRAGNQGGEIAVAAPSLPRRPRSA